MINEWQSVTSHALKRDIGDMMEKKENHVELYYRYIY